VRDTGLETDPPDLVLDGFEACRILPAWELLKLIKALLRD